MRARLSILDLAPVGWGETASDSFAANVALARGAEELGYERVWYAEHHNIPTIASSATSVLIAHVGAQTRTIRLGAGGVMLPNHAPLLIAEQFGTLAAMYPDRIDLGLGRAPGGDQSTMHALRRDPNSADTFPEDVLELQGYLTGNSVIPGVAAIPGQGSNVPLYILGSSLFGARLAAALGLPYAFASHFAPADRRQVENRQTCPHRRHTSVRFVGGAGNWASALMPYRPHHAHCLTRPRPASGPGGASGSWLSGTSCGSVARRGMSRRHTVERIPFVNRDSRAVDTRGEGWLFEDAATHRPPRIDRRDDR